MPFTPISLDHHASCGFDPVTDYHSAASHPLIPVYLHEHALLINSVPLCFIKQDDTYLLMALVGSTEAGCAYLRTDGAWATPYVPVALRGRPFNLLQTAEGEKLVLCIDDDALTDGSSGERLFNAQGELSDAVKTHLDLLKQRQSVIKPTQEAVNTLAEAGVLKEWDVVLRSAEGSAKTKGLYSIDQDALNTLPAETYHSLQGNPMALAHAQLFSMRNIRLLNVLLDNKLKHQTEEFDLDAFFDGSDDTLKFNL